MRQEPPEPARQVCVPVDQRIDRGQIYRARVYRFPEAAALAGLGPIQGHPAVLLANEMKDRQVGQCAPEYDLAAAVQDYSRHQARNGNHQVQPSAAPQFARIEIDSESSGVDMRDV